MSLPTFVSILFVVVILSFQIYFSFLTVAAIVLLLHVVHNFKSELLVNQNILEFIVGMTTTLSVAYLAGSLAFTSCCFQYIV